jgi:hypothetical protein
VYDVSVARVSTIREHSLTELTIDKEPPPMPKACSATLAIAAAGFAPITALSLAVFGIAQLPLATVVLIPPAVVVLLAVLVLSPQHRAASLRGFIFGLVAVTAYDAFRLPFMVSGIWHDFIPRIGMWLLGDGRLHPIVGYAYRYIGDGGGMGLTFAVLYPLVNPRRLGALATGVVYGVAIWACLMGTLVLAPRGQEMMFVLTPLSVTLSLGGHLIYGGVLGLLTVASSTAPFTARARDLLGRSHPSVVTASP